MNPAVLAMIASSVTEALKLALQGMELVRKGNAGELTDAEVRAHWARMNDNYNLARKTWDDA